MEFALVSALQLAEGGKNIKERRLGTLDISIILHIYLMSEVGYRYLMEMLPRHHELGLLMINTIRKVSLQILRYTE